MDFVWIYIHKFSYFGKSGLWNEIEYSIKSVRQNYPGARCWVVGDDPGFGVNHIPCEQVERHDKGYPAEIDVVKKFRKIIESDVGEEFILMYDDIFILNPVTYEDFKITYGYSHVDNVEEYARKWSRSYKMLWKNTYRIIANLVDDIYDWETHLPRLYDKFQLEQVLDAYDCDNVPLIATSLYAAHYIKDTVLMDDSVQYDLFNVRVVDYTEGFKCKFMNIMDETIDMDFENKMKEVFGESTSVKSAHR